MNSVIGANVQVGPRYEEHLAQGRMEMADVYCQVCQGTLPKLLPFAPFVIAVSLPHLLPSPSLPLTSDHAPLTTHGS